jgi:hypothetical protein
MDATIEKGAPCVGFRTPYLFLFIVLQFLAAPLTLSSADLSSQTVKAWDEYIRATNSRMQNRLAGTTPFLWIDEAPDRRERIRKGEIVAEPASQDGPKKVPQGLIHHWIGAVFIPNTTIKAVFSVLNDYDRYDRFFNPAVITAKLLDDSGDKRDFSMVLLEKAPFVTAAIASEYTSDITRVDDQHWYTISYSTRIQQIDNYGQAGQHELPPDQGAGFVWRLYSIERFEEKDGGVYVELEAIALSRNIPLAIQWLVKPIVQHLPRNSMVATLQKTRDAVRAEARSNAPELAELRQFPGSVHHGTDKSLGSSRHGLGSQQAFAATAASAHPHD